jgi:hypothetical protein
MTNQIKDAPKPSISSRISVFLRNPQNAASQTDHWAGKIAAAGLGGLE